MNGLKRYALIFFEIVVFNTINAQVSDTIRKWGMQDCIQYAIEHNIQISTLRLNEQLVLQDLIAAKADKIPGLSATISNTITEAKNDGSVSGKLVSQLTSGGSYSLNSSVILWNGQYINNNIRQQELLTQSARLSVQQSQNNITLLITQAYLDILLAKENLKYIADLVGTSEARVKQGQLFYDAGSIAKKDLLQLQAQLASDKYLQVQIQNAIRQNILSLKQILQLSTDTFFDIETPVYLAVSAEMPALEQVQHAALQSFPEIKIGKLGIEIISLDIAKAKAGFKPILSASGSLGTGYNEVVANAVFPRTGYFTQAGNNFYQRLGLTLFVPIFSNRINKTNLEKSNIAYRQAGLNFKNYQLVLSQEVEQAYLKAENAQQAYDAANLQLLAATESYRIVNEQVRLGAINTYDLLQQRNQYVQAVQAFIQAKYTAVLQQKIYAFYLGNPVTL